MPPEYFDQFWYKMILGQISIFNALFDLLKIFRYSMFQCCSITKHKDALTQQESKNYGWMKRHRLIDIHIDRRMDGHTQIDGQTDFDNSFINNKIN
jgi:hypothetical protein